MDTAWSISKFITEEEIQRRELDLLTDEVENQMIRVASRGVVQPILQGKRAKIIWCDYEGGGETSGGYIQKRGDGYVLGFKHIIQNTSVKAGDFIGLNYSPSTNTFHYNIMSKDLIDSWLSGC